MDGGAVISRSAPSTTSRAPAPQRIVRPQARSKIRETRPERGVRSRPRDPRNHAKAVPIVATIQNRTARTRPSRVVPAYWTPLAAAGIPLATMDDGPVRQGVYAEGRRANPDLDVPEAAF